MNSWSNGKTCSRPRKKTDRLGRQPEDRSLGLTALDGAKPSSGMPDRIDHQNNKQSRSERDVLIGTVCLSGVDPLKGPCHFLNLSLSHHAQEGLYGLVADEFFSVVEDDLGNR